jgi:invasion protein IalB
MPQNFQQGRMPHMRVSEKAIACGLAATLLLALVGYAAAQQPAAPPKPAPPQRPPAQHTAPPPVTQGQATPAAPVDQSPQRTTASYGDWTVVCEIAPGPPPRRNCEMNQVAERQVQGQTATISRVAIGLPPKGEPAKLVVQLPVNVLFAAPLKITTDAKDVGISTPFRHCVPSGCFAEIELKDDLQKKFRAATEPGKILYRSAAEQEVIIPLSFKGFPQAFEALLKQ